MTIQTSDIDDAGSDSTFYYTFIGTKGETAEHLADLEGNDRQAGQLETWTFTDSADIGEFKCISIRIDGGDGWHFEEVNPNFHGWYSYNHIVGFLCFGYECILLSLAVNFRRVFIQYQVDMAVKYGKNWPKNTEY